MSQGDWTTHAHTTAGKCKCHPPIPSHPFTFPPPSPLPASCPPPAHLLPYPAAPPFTCSHLLPYPATPHFTCSHLLSARSTKSRKLLLRSRTLVLRAPHAPPPSRPLCTAARLTAAADQGPPLSLAPLRVLPPDLDTPSTLSLPELGTVMPGLLPSPPSRPRDACLRPIPWSLLALGPMCTIMPGLQPSSSSRPRGARLRPTREPGLRLRLRLRATWGLRAASWSWARGEERSWA